LPLGPIARLRWKLSPTRAIIQFSIGRRRGGWFVTYVVFSGLLTVRRALSRHPERLTVDKLEPGHRLTVRTFPVKSAKERKGLLRGETGQN
jgi:hypothetical protein